MHAPPKTPEPTPAPQDAETDAKKTREDRKPEPLDPERKQQIVALRAWADGAQGLPDLMHRVESELLQWALEGSGKTRREIARLLHTNERTLYHKDQRPRDRGQPQLGPRMKSRPCGR